jgi:hypothetical protein
MREEAIPDSMSGNRSRTCFWARCGGSRGKKKSIRSIISWVEGDGGAMDAPKTYPVTSDLFGSDKFAIKTEIRPLRCGACWVGSCRVAAV